MKTTVLLRLIVFISISSCSSTEDDGATTDQPSGSGNGTAANPGPINTAFNGYMLSKKTIRSERLSDSTNFYRYDSNLNTITFSSASGINADAEISKVRRIIELDNNGLPQKISRFTNGEIVLTDTYSFNVSGQLETRAIEFPSTGPLSGERPRQNSYLYNAAGQISAEVTSDQATGIQTSRTNYEYADDGTIIRGISVGIATTTFTSDQSGRVSGWSQENSIGDFVVTASYTYDENNNITMVEIFDESGILSRTLNYSYVKTNTPIYNMVWFDYLYSPQID